MTALETSLGAMLTTREERYNCHHKTGCLPNSKNNQACHDGNVYSKDGQPKDGHAVASKSQDNEGSMELDTHANTCVACSNMVALNLTSKVVSVSPFRKSEFKIVAHRDCCNSL